MKTQHSNFPLTQLRVIVYVLAFFIVLVIAVQTTFAQDETEAEQDELALNGELFTETPEFVMEATDDDENGGTDELIEESAPVTPQPTLAPVEVTIEATPVSVIETVVVIETEVTPLPAMTETPLPELTTTIEPPVVEPTTVETGVPTEIAATQTDDTAAPVPESTEAVPDAESTEITTAPAIVETETVLTPPVEATEQAPVVSATDAPADAAAPEANASPETPTPAPADVIDGSQLYGHIDSSQPLSDITINIVGASIQQSVEVQSNGSFVTELPYGSYQVTVSAPLHADYVQDIVIVEEPLVLPIILLKGGDADGDGNIDAQDVETVVDHFGQSSSAGDLTGDNLTDIRDLAIVGANLTSDS